MVKLDQMNLNQGNQRRMTAFRIYWGKKKKKNLGILIKLRDRDKSDGGALRFENVSKNLGKKATKIYFIWFVLKHFFYYKALRSKISIEQ